MSRRAAADESRDPKRGGPPAADDRTPGHYYAVELDDALFLPCQTCKRPVRLREARLMLHVAAAVVCLECAPL